MNAHYLVPPALFICAAPALANVSVANPKPSTRVVSPFLLSATAELCSSQAIASMGYSIDNSTYTATVTGAALNTNVAAAIGAHVLHVKSWGVQGAPCVTDVAITVVPSPLASVPGNARVSRDLQDWSGWLAAFDTATGNGSAVGFMTLAPTSLGEIARAFTTYFLNSAGERYSLNFATESAPMNFLYDTWVYIPSPSSNIANLEMDMNEVIWNGDTVIYGVRCGGSSNTWDYTANAGSPENYKDVWLHSGSYCNPREWSTNMWHHVQMTYSRNDTGDVTYQSIFLDGVEQIINETVPSAFSLGWSECLLTNFQVDGLGASGWATVYADHMAVYRW